MAKPPDQANTTQPLSQSQVLTVSPQKSPVVDKNDRSVWKGLVVPAGEFAPAQAKRSSRARTWAIVGVLGGAGVAGGALYAAGVFGSRGSSPPAVAAPSASAPVPMPPPPVPDAAPVAIVPQDAAVAAPLDADAVSSAALPTKATKAIAPVKKRPPKKRGR